MQHTRRPATAANRRMNAAEAAMAAASLCFVLALVLGGFSGQGRHDGPLLTAGTAEATPS